MGKIATGPRMLFYPRPTFLIGANVDGRPNFMTVGGGGGANGDPPMVSVPIQPQRYTYKGIRQNLTFSVNVPSVDLVRETDYCGIVSGSKVNKVEVCQFKIFYGKLGSAPLIEQCPVNLECKVIHILNLGSHSLVIGRVEETYFTESCLTDGKPDASKINAMIYITQPDGRYQAFGPVIAKSHTVGQELKAKE